VLSFPQKTCPTIRPRLLSWQEIKDLILEILMVKYQGELEEKFGTLKPLKEFLQYWFHCPDFYPLSHTPDGIRVNFTRTFQGTTIKVEDFFKSSKLEEKFSSSLGGKVIYRYSCRHEVVEQYDGGTAGPGHYSSVREINSYDWYHYSVA
jgi:hypothetical protein